MRHNPGYGIMGQLMAPRREIRLDRMERMGIRQRDRVGAWGVMRTAAAVDHLDGDGVEKRADIGGEFADRPRIGRLGIIVGGQAIDLRSVEDVVPLHEADRLFGGFPGELVSVGLARRVVVDAERAAFAFADLTAKLAGLPVRHPERAGVARGIGDGPQEEAVDPGIGDALMSQRPGAGRRPGFEPGGCALLDLLEDQVGNGLGDVGARYHWPGAAHGKSPRAAGAGRSRTFKPSPEPPPPLPLSAFRQACRSIRPPQVSSNAVDSVS